MGLYQNCQRLPLADYSRGRITWPMAVLCTGPAHFSEMLDHHDFTPLILSCGMGELTSIPQSRLATKAVFQMYMSLYNSDLVACEADVTACSLIAGVRWLGANVVSMECEPIWGSGSFTPGGFLGQSL